MHIPKQLQDEIKAAVPHLRLILPAAAAVAWVFGKIVGRKPKAIEDKFSEELGDVVAVVLPSRSGAKVPFLPPRPLHHVLLDATFPVGLDSLWSYLLSGDSAELASFHTALGETDVELGPWRRQPDGRRVRILRFTTPLNKPLGPKASFNREEIAVEHLSSTAFVLDARADSRGVPFASAFENRVRWVAKEEGSGQTRLTITGECIFLTPVWGPLKGTINRESIKGMQRAYATLESILADTFGILNTWTPGSTLAGKAAAVAVAAPATDADVSGVMAFLRDPQAANPAVLVVIVAMVILMWRMAMLNAFTLQLFTQVAARARA